DPECKDVITYPEIMLKGDRTLCHIHGRAFLLDGEDPIVEKYHLRNLVYTKDGYKAAYEDEKEIETFLYEITRKHSLVFLGFSMNDENFRRTFNAIIGARTRKNKRKAGIMGVAPSELPNFVFLDVPEKAPHQSDPDFMLVMVDYNKKVSDLQGEGFRVVSFKRLDTSFLGLKRALQQIEQKIRYAALPKQKEPTFEVTDSSTASVSDS
ncbi:MAG: SIR2 family protein, partial [Bacteroidota bacterium]